MKPLPEEIYEMWLWYQDMYMNGEDEEMFDRDMLLGLMYE